MAVNPYSSQSISGYNSSPPPDDGSQTSANKVEWAKHKTKLGDPNKALSEAINSQAVSAFNTLALEAWSLVTTTATIAEGDWHKGLLCAATTPINFPDPATLEDGWHVNIFNAATGPLRLAATATSFFKDFDGRTASGADLFPGDSVRVYNTATVWVPQGGVRSVVVQRTYAEYTANADLTTVIPYDDTIPQATEGTQIVTAALTPTNTGSRIRVRFQGFGSIAANTAAVAALFRDSVADALAVTASHISIGNEVGQLVLEFEETAPSASAITYKIRAGAAAGTLRMNGTPTARLFGGAARSTLIVEEIRP